MIQWDRYLLSSFIEHLLNDHLPHLSIHSLSEQMFNEHQLYTTHVCAGRWDHSEQKRSCPRADYSYMLKNPKDKQPLGIPKRKGKVFQAEGTACAKAL